VESTIFFSSFEKYILPLRKPIVKGTVHLKRKDGRTVDYSKYDYSEVEKCVKLLLSGKLKTEDLPVYSIETRLRLQEEENQKLTEEQQTKLEDSLKKKFEDKYLGDIKELNKSIIAKQAEYEANLKKIAKSKGEDKETLASLELESKRLQDSLAEKTKQHEAKTKELNNKIKSMPKEIRDKIEAKLREEIKADKNREQEKQMKLLKESLAKKEKELAEQERQLKDKREKYQKEVDIDVWVGVINKQANDLFMDLGYGRTRGFWKLFDKPLIQKMASNLMNVAGELRQLENELIERKLLK